MKTNLRIITHAAAIGIRIAFQLQHLLEVPLQRATHFLALAKPRRRTGLEKDRAVAEYQRRVFDENRIRECFQRRKNVHHRSISRNAAI